MENLVYNSRTGVISPFIYNVCDPVKMKLIESYIEEEFSFNDKKLSKVINSGLQFSNSCIQVSYEKHDFGGFIMSMICANQIKITLPFEINSMAKPALIDFLSRLMQEHIETYPPNPAVFERLGNITGFKYETANSQVWLFDSAGNFIE